jgi:hypothetical protein
MCASCPLFRQTGLQQMFGGRFGVCQKVREVGLRMRNPSADMFIKLASKKDFHTNRPPKS